MQQCAALHIGASMVASACLPLEVKRDDRVMHPEMPLIAMATFLVQMLQASRGVIGVSLASGIPEDKR
jgi:hypothetical protein